MIAHHTCVSITCDTCGNGDGEDGGSFHWESEETAHRETTRDRDYAWRWDGDRHTCPHCVKRERQKACKHEMTSTNAPDMTVCKLCGWFDWRPATKETVR